MKTSAVRLISALAVALMETACALAQTPDESSLSIGSETVAAKEGAVGAFARPTRVERIQILPDECWWGGCVMEGMKQPFTAASEGYACDMRLRHGPQGGNQAAPVLLSSKGRWVWCEQAFRFSVAKGVLTIEAEKNAPVLTGAAKGGTLRDAYLHCSKTFFPPKGTPKLKFFEAPIINTWIELKYEQNEKDILAYGKSFVDHGMPAGVYMIDHTWHREPFGCWDFHDGRFNDPKGMVKKLNAMGYTMMLWFDPHISTDTAVYRQLRKEGLLLKGPTADGIAESCWWPGKGAILDCTNPKAYAWLKGTLDRLMDDYGVEGFFFDAGDAYNYPPNAKPFVKDASPSDQVRAFHLIGLDVPYQQHRASWKMGGLPLMQTLRDKHPTYEEVHECIADGLLCSLIGYPFVVFDLVGGGTVSNFEGANFTAAQTHYIRSLQTQCLSPMIQFSLSPWRVLDARHQQIVKDMIALRQKWAPYITQCAVDCGKTGEPMMRSMEYMYPGHGWERVDDQFFMGEKLLVAPQVADKNIRTVVIPPGTWTADDGEVIVGPKTITVKTPLERLPHFVKEAHARLSVKAGQMCASLVESGWWRLASVDRLTDVSGRDYGSTNRVALFSIELVSTGNLTNKLNVTAADAATRTAEKLPDGMKITYSGFKDRLEHVVCTVRTASDGKLRWGIAVTPKVGFAATAVNYPQMLLEPRLGRTGADDALVHGGRLWGLVHNPGETWNPKKWEGLWLTQPGNLFAQFYGYYDGEGGFYSAAEDARAHAKRLCVYRTASGLLSFWTWLDWIDAAREQPYEIVMDSFRGPDGESTDWTDAADVYRRWARAQRWCRTPFRDRADLPDWLRSAAPIVRFNRDWLANPEQVRAWIENYWRRRYPQMPLCGAVWGWEKLGTWITPDYFPAYPDDATFAKVVAAFRDNDVRFFPWPSGYNWTLSFKTRSDKNFTYESRDAFAKFEHLAIRKDDGEPLIKKPSWYNGGEMPVLCRGDARTRAWWTASVADELFARGAELIQFDQVNGGRHDPCWSRDHGHAPGAGLWWAESAHDQLDQVMAAGRRRGIVPVLGFEDPNEFYLDRVGMQDYRDVEIGSSNRTVASVWNYLYHEFVPTFQSNPRRGDRWKQAHCAADGQMPFLVPQAADVGDCEAVVNGKFSVLNPSTGIPVGWAFGHCQDRGGKLTVERGAAPGGLNSVHLTASRGEKAYFNVDSSTANDGAYVPGRRYRFSCLAKVNAGAGAFCADWIFTMDWKSLGGTRLTLPAAGEGWTRVTGEFVMPAGAAIIHYAFIVPGDGDAEIADMKVESVADDGTASKLMLKGDDAYTAFMSRWVALYHGEGRDFLAYGRRVRPPRVDCDRMFRRFADESADFSGEVETVCSAAYETLDGSRRALVLANATDRAQPVAWTWGGARTELTLKPDEIRIVPLSDKTVKEKQ